jgi:ferric iron reductase protein FhuF
MNWRDGRFAPMLGAVLAGDDPRTVVSLPELLQPRVLDQLLLKIYGVGLMPSHKPVLVSQWSKFYFQLWLPPMLVSQLAHGWELPLALRDVGLALDERGVPVAIRFFDAGEAGDAQASLEPWLAANLRPLIEALSRYGEVPAAVLWGNAGDCFEQALRQLQAVGLQQLGAAQALLETRRLADGRANPMYAPVRYLGDGRRERRSCCLSYQVPWIGHCEQCPLPQLPVH